MKSFAHETHQEAHGAAGRATVEKNDAQPESKSEREWKIDDDSIEQQHTTHSPRTLAGFN